MTINNEVNFSIVDRMNALTNAEDIKNTAGQTLDIVGIMTYTTVDMMMHATHKEISSQRLPFLLFTISL